MEKEELETLLLSLKKEINAMSEKEKALVTVLKKAFDVIRFYRDENLHPGLAEKFLNECKPILKEE